jgi:D-hexose-6-phosphate mutarotase
VPAPAHPPRYFSISNIDKITIKSDAFDGATFLDKTESPPASKPCASSEVKITKETDSVYAGVAGEVRAPLAP